MIREARAGDLRGPAGFGDQRKKLGLGPGLRRPALSLGPHSLGGDWGRRCRPKSSDADAKQARTSAEMFLPSASAKS